MTRRAGLLGGAFNPPHYGHLHPAREALDALGLQRVVFIPAGVHPFKGPEILAPVEQRLTMLRLALADQPGFELWEIEARSPEVSYTVETLEAWHRHQADEEPVLLIGADILRELHLWKAWRRIMELAHVALLTRPGFDPPTVEACPALAHLERFRVDAAEGLDRSRLGGYGFVQLPVTPWNVASTELRRRLRAGESLQALTPDAVIDYAQSHGLYGRGVNFFSTPRSEST
ncbi:MAG: nicotinate (nicotinamide) nucleotide adenylyltransferase [Magnetococcales bacterium]|nr:nicotinate (nicotinamide) nucleotide adenylyltransferase [Magnetococcales bacterium]